MGRPDPRRAAGVPAAGLDRPPAKTPTPAPSRRGLNARILRYRREHEGAVEGRPTVHGWWLGDRIRVQRQTGERPGFRSPSWSEPPCAPPPDGWPSGLSGSPPGNLDVDLGDLDETGAVVSVVIFRPGHDQAVLVVAATDVDAVEARLRPQLSDRLCVVASRWTRGQIDRAHDHLRSMWQHWGIYRSGPSCDERAQITVMAELVRVTDEIARWVQTQPDGLVALEPWPAPVGVSRAPR